MNFDNEIKKMINAKFPQLTISIFPDETQDNKIVAIDDDLYYSDDYLSLVMDIKMNLLWKNNIFNYLFVKEKYREWVPVPGPTILNKAIIVTISFSTEYKSQFTALRDVNYSTEDDICLQAA
jgi:hypothetical protein